jgi:hypothetical protein
MKAVILPKSQRMINVFVKHPIFLDAFAEVCNQRGDIFMAEWGKIMTESKKK